MAHRLSSAASWPTHMKKTGHEGVKLKSFTYSKRKTESPSMRPKPKILSLWEDTTSPPRKKWPLYQRFGVKEKLCLLNILVIWNNQVSNIMLDYYS